MDITLKTIDQYKQTYLDLFDELPSLPAGKFEFSNSLESDEFLLLAEEVRYRAFFSDHLDQKTTQLICFSLLLKEGSRAALHHAHAAKKLGATFEELWQVCKLTSTVCGGLGPLNFGGTLLDELRRQNAKQNDV